MSVQGNAQEIARLLELREAAHEVWKTSRYLRAVEGATIARNDPALQRLYAAARAADELALVVRPERKTGGKRGTNRR